MEGEESSKLSQSFVLLIVTIMIIVSVLFERGKEYLFEKTSRNMTPILVSLFGELTLLGFIGLLLFLILKYSSLKEISEDLFGADDTIGELCESVHMVLFLTMVIFLIAVVSLVIIGENIEHEWADYEHQCYEQSKVIKNFAQQISKKKGLQNNTFFQKLLEWVHGIVKQDVSEEIFAYAAIRKKFISNKQTAQVSGKVLQKNFPFNEYLSVMLGKMIAELVEVPIKTWFILEFLLICFWVVFVNVSDDWRFIYCLFLGFSLPVVLIIVRNKVLEIRDKSRSPEFCEEANKLAMNTNSSSKYEQIPQLSVISAPTWAESMNAESDEEKNDRETNEPVESKTIEIYDHSFWFGNTHSIHFTLGLIRLTLLLLSIYLAMFFVLFFPHIIKIIFNEKDLQNEEHSIIHGPISAIFVLLISLLPPTLIAIITPKIFKDFTVVSNIETLQKSMVVERVLRLFKTAKSLKALQVIHILSTQAKKKIEKVTSQGLWINLPETEKEMIRVEFDRLDTNHKGYLNEEQLTELLINVLHVLPEEAKQEARLLQEIAKKKRKGVSFDEVCRALTVQTISHDHAFDYTRSIRNYFKILDQKGNKDGKISERELKDGFEKLCRTNISHDDWNKLISTAQFDENDEIDEEGFVLVMQTGLTNANSKDSIDRETNQNHLLSAAHALKAAAKFKSLALSKKNTKLKAKTLPRHKQFLFRETFKMFDTNGEGVISSDQMLEFFHKFGLDFGEADLQTIISTIDEDGDGTISLDEFMNYVEKLEVHEENALENNDSIALGMFQLVDVDGSQKISVSELAKVLQNFGQEMSVGDVNHVLRFIDEDGDGTMDFKEFKRLLKELGIFRSF